MTRPLLLALLVLLPDRGFSQSVDAVVHGGVTDPSGAAVSGATVALTNRDTGLSRVVISAADGSYRLPPVPAGTYDLTAAAAGFAPLARRGTDLHVAAIVRIDLSFTSVTASGTVAVAARAPLLATTQHTIARLVLRDELDTLPVVDRNFNGLASLATGVTATGSYGGVDIGGSRDFQNAYIVDGVSAEGLGAGEQRVRYAQDWIREFQVLSAQAAAEFGRASGGVLNAITRSGSNVATGRLSGYFRDASWDATPLFATSKPPLRSHRLGGTYGGRLVPDRLFVFGGYEWFDDAVGKVVNTAFTELNGTVAATTSDHVWIGKLDYHPGSSRSWRARYNGQLRRATNAGVGGRVTEQHGVAADYTAHELVGAANQMLSPSIFNELRAAWTLTADDTRCNFAQHHPPGTWFTIQYTRTFLGCPGGGFGRKATGEIQVLENLSWSRGRHDVKVGGYVSHGRSDGDYRFLRDGLYAFRGDAPFDAALPSTYPFIFTLFEGDTIWDYARWSWGAFAQDRWRVSSDLTINAGIRYDVDGSFAALNPLIRIDRGLSSVRRDLDNLDPRLGVAWTPFDNDGRTALRGGTGLYHDESHLNVVTLLLFNSVLVHRAVFLNAQTPEAPFASTAAVRAYLAEAFARNRVPNIALLPGSVGATPDLSSNLQIPFTVQTSGGVLHAFERGLTVSADVVFTRGLEQYTIRDMNVDRHAALVERPGRIVRVNPAFAAINRYGSDGSFTYRALQLQAGYAPAPGHHARLSYTLARTTSNTRTTLEGIGGPSGVAGATNPFDIAEDSGPADHDVRHHLNATWSTSLPWRVQLSGILTARSALPWSVALEQLDAAVDPDPFQDRPEPRNSRRGDGYASVDVRLARTIRLAQRTSASLFVEAFNAANTANMTGYVNNRASASFALPNAALDGRRIQLGLRLDF